MKQTGTFHVYEIKNSQRVVSPIPNAFIYFVQNNSIKLTVKTDDKGKYNFDLPLGEYTVASASDGGIEQLLANGSKFILNAQSKVTAFEEWVNAPSADVDTALLKRFKELAKIAEDAAREANSILADMTDNSIGDGEWVRKTYVDDEIAEIPKPDMSEYRKLDNHRFDQGWLAVRAKDNAGAALNLERQDGFVKASVAVDGEGNLSLNEYSTGSPFAKTFTFPSEGGELLIDSGLPFVTPEMFAHLNTDGYDTNSLQAAFDDPRICILAPKEYTTDKPLIFNSHKVIKGSGHEVTRIRKTKSSKSGIAPNFIQGKNVILDVDAVLIANSTKSYWYTERFELSGFSLKRDKDEDDTEGAIPIKYVLYAPMIAQSSVSDVQLEGGNVYGVYSIDYWMMSWNRVHSKCDAPFLLGDHTKEWKQNGTSNTFISCWATNAKGNNYAWDITDLKYSSMLSCGTDGVGLDGFPAEGVYKLNKCDITFISCGSEIIHARTFAKVTNGSSINFVNCNFDSIYNKYNPSNPSWNNTNALFQCYNSKLFFSGGNYIRGVYKSTSPEFKQSLIHCDDRGSLEWGAMNTVEPKIDGVVRGTSSPTLDKFLITYTSSCQARIYTNRLNIVDIPNLDATSETSVEVEDAYIINKIIKTSRHIESSADSSEGIDLNSLRGKGSIVVDFHKASTNTLEKNFPLANEVGVLVQEGVINGRVIQSMHYIVSDKLKTFKRMSKESGWFTPWN